ncbi:MAG: 3-deoxy-D-manno-octulosonic acid kinase [Gammaproteobacteria bacterium]
MEFRKTVVDGGFILADAALEPSPDWFDPAYWKRNGLGQPLGRGRGVAVSAGTDGQWVLRHYHRGGVPGRLIKDSYIWCGESAARPVRELRVLAELAEAGAPVPNPVAVRVVRSGLCYRGDILVTRIRDARPLAEVAATLPEARWAEVGRAVHRFHAAGGWHADLNARNVLVTPQAVFVIDLDHGRRGCSNADKQRHNLDRLLRSLHKLNLMPAAENGWRALLEAYEMADPS